MPFAEKVLRVNMEVADPSKVLVYSRVLGVMSQKMVQSLLYILVVPMLDFSGGIK